MLKYSINRNYGEDDKYSYLNDDTFFEYDERDKGYVTVFKTAHQMFDGQTVCFSRSFEGNTIFYDERPLKRLGKNKLLVESFGEYMLPAYEVSAVTVEYNIGECAKKFIEIDFLSEHPFFGDIDYGYANEYVSCDYSNPQDMRRCVGDVYKVGDFLWKAEEIASGGLYAKSSNCLNTVVSDVAIYTKEDGHEHPFNGLSIFVPSAYEGIDDLFRLYVEYDEDVLDFLSGNPTLYCKDCRFFSFESGNMGNLSGTYYVRHSNTDIYVDMRFWRISIPAAQSFGAAFQDDVIGKEDFIDRESQKLVNKIDDYEKMMFEPVCNSGGTLYDLDKVKFILHFRDRARTVTEDGSDDYYGDWTIDKSVLSYSGESKKEGVGEPVGSLGFTDDDIYYQKNSLTNSFIRICVYDSGDRMKQKLLFYSTVFVDSRKMYDEYLTAKTSEDYNGNGRICDETGDFRIPVEFECESMYDTDSSSEGFYQYYFSDIVTGVKPTTVYMKVEFNHAKYGRVVPFCTGKEKYEETKDVFSDMHMKVNLKYDKKGNRYVWYPVEDGTIDGDNTLTFELWEPIL